MTESPSPAAASFDSPVAVTGAGGYVASWVVRELLARGATVHATVRDPSATDKVGHLTELAAQLPGTLRLFAADLLQPGSFDAAFAGAGVVIHTASPFIVQNVKDAQRQLVDPAREGTRNVLAAVERAESVRRVVLTSSCAAIYGDGVDAAALPGRRFTEEHWNESSSLTHNPYPYSKTVAERLAWELASKQQRYRLVVINPSFVLGPSLSRRTDGTSVGTLLDFASGKFRSGVPDLWLAMVDVRDVATAHLEAALRPDAEGRHIVSAEDLSFPTLAARLRALFGDRYLWPRGALPSALVYAFGWTQGFTWRWAWRNLGQETHFDHRRSVERLGLRYRPLDETLRDAYADLEAAGLLTPRAARR